MVIALVALIVIGPEKLPEVVRTLGSLIGRVQRYAASVRRDLAQELQLPDELPQQIRREVDALGQEVKNSLPAIEAPTSDATQRGTTSTDTPRDGA